MAAVTTPRDGIPRALLAALLPALVVAVQLAWWRELQPYGWMLFVPAVLASAWLGGRWMGVLASAATTILVWWLFVPPEGSFAKEPRLAVPALVYFATGVVLSVFVGRLRRDRGDAGPLPIAPRADAVEERRVPASAAPPGIRGRAEGALILVVEQSPELSRFVCDTLASEHRVAAAFDAKDGLDKAIALRPDLALIDTTLLGTSGEDLVRVMRRIPELESTPIVLLAAKSRDVLSMRVLREGAVDYVTKPFSADEIRARVDNALERLRMERALGASRDDLNRAQAVAHIGSWRLDVRRNELVWTAENYRIFGVPEGTPMTYEGFLAIVHPDDRAYVDRMWNAALAGEPYDIEHRIIAGGEEKWVRERAELMFDDRGQLLGGIGTTQDVTDRKRIEDALRAAEHVAIEKTLHIRKLLDASVALSDAVATLPETTMTAMMTAIAAQARTLVGADYVAIGIGSDPTKPFDPWVQVGMHPEIARRLGRPPRPVGTLGLVSCEHRELRVRDVRHHAAFRGFPPGHPVMTSFLGVPIRFRGAALGNMFLANKRGADEFTEDDQRVVELVAARAGTALESVRLYDAEATERAWMQTVIDQMPEGLLLVDARGVVTVENRNLRALSRTDTRERDEFGNPVLLDLHLPSRERVPLSDLPYVRALREGVSFSGRELLVRQSDGRFVPVLVSVAPVTRANGARSGAVMIVQDITYLKELERMREEWTSVVAHDLRQPVNTISVHAALLDDTGRAPLDDERRARAVASIRASVKMLDRMIHDLLDASRIDASRLSIDRREIPLPALVRELLERWPEYASCCELELAPGSDRAVIADPGRIEQVLGNLLSNAQKYGEPGAPIRIAMVPREDELEVIVTNRGPGIAPDDLPRIFQRFERSRAVRDRGIPGIGLGLYVSKGLVEAHGGRIWVESTPGETTSFHFTLPFAGARRTEPDARA